MEKPSEIGTLLERLRSRIDDERSAEVCRSYADEVGDWYDEKHYRGKRDSLGLEAVRMRLRELDVEIPNDLQLYPEETIEPLEAIIAAIRKRLPANLVDKFEDFAVGPEKARLREVHEGAASALDYCNESFSEFWEAFGNSLFHITTPPNWNAIVEAGEIRPSGAGHQGSMKYSPGHQCQAAKRQAVALFDLAAPSMMQIFTNLRNWLNTLDILMKSRDRRFDSHGVLIEIERDSLETVLLSGSPLSGSLSLAHVEFHHIGPIPLRSVSRAFELRSKHRGALEIYREIWPPS